MPFAASAFASRRLSMLTTITPLAIADCSTGTSALESAGAITIASTRCASICSTRRIWPEVSISSLMPFGDQVVLSGMRR